MQQMNPEMQRKVKRTLWLVALRLVLGLVLAAAVIYLVLR